MRNQRGTELAAGHPFTQGHVGRIESSHESDGDQVDRKVECGLLLDEVSALHRGGCQRLFAQHRLPSGERDTHQAGMRVVTGGDYHGINIGILDQCHPIGVHPGIQLSSNRTGNRSVEITHGDQFGTGYRPGQLAGVVCAHDSDTDHADTHVHATEYYILMS